MELRDYWRVFKRRAWIPGLLAIAAMVTAGALAYMSKPSYTATATVVIRTGNGIERPISFQQAAGSNSVALGAIQKVGVNLPIEQFISRIHVTSVGGNLYRVSVTDTNPNVAAALANEVATEAAALYQQVGSQAVSVAGDTALTKARDDLRQQYISAALARFKFQQQHPNGVANGIVKDVAVAAQTLQLQLEEDAAGGAYRGVLDQLNRERLSKLAVLVDFDARVVDQAVAKPDTSGRFVEVLSAGALALLAGAAIVFLLEYLDKSVREPDEAEEMVGAPVIGIIPRASPQTLRAIKGGA